MRLGQPGPISAASDLRTTAQSPGNWNGPGPPHRSGMAGDLLSIATWIFLGLVTAVLSGAASATVQLAGFAPLGLTSIATGSALGAALAGLARLCNTWPNRTTLLLTLLFATAAVVTQHVWMYRGYCDQWHRVHDENPAVALFRNESGPKSVGVYLREEATPLRTLMWGVDAILIAATTAGIFATLRAGPVQSPSRVTGNQHIPPA